MESILDMQIIGLVAAFMVWKIAELVITKLIPKKNGNGEKVYIEKINAVLKEMELLRADEKEVHKELGSSILADIKENKRIVYEVKEKLTQNTRTIDDIWTKLIK